MHFTDTILSNQGEILDIWWSASYSLLAPLFVQADIFIFCSLPRAYENKDYLTMPHRGIYVPYC